MAIFGDVTGVFGRSFSTVGYKISALNGDAGEESVFEENLGVLRHSLQRDDEQFERASSYQGGVHNKAEWQSRLRIIVDDHA